MANYLLAEARVSHVEELTKLAMKALREGNEKGLPFCKDKVRSEVKECVTNTHQLSVVVLVNGKIKGMVLGHVGPHAYAKGLVASDLALYVSPSLRGTDCYKKLATVFDKWCDGIPNLLGRMLSLSRLNASTQVMESLYKSLDYKPTGKDFMKLESQYQ